MTAMIWFRSKFSLLAQVLVLLLFVPIDRCELYKTKYAQTLALRLSVWCYCWMCSSAHKNSLCSKRREEKTFHIEMNNANAKWLSVYISFTFRFFLFSLLFSCSRLLFSFLVRTISSFFTSFLFPICSASIKSFLSPIHVPFRCIENGKWKEIKNKEKCMCKHMWTKESLLSGNK